MKRLIGFLIFYLCANLTFGQLKTGAEQMNKYLPLLMDKKVGIVANHTSLINDTHLLDSLLTLKINVVKILSPEHGFKGNNADGALISNSAYGKDRIPIISLYGKHKKPTKEDLQDVDIILFDMQDVGVRCYTYISTMSYVMEACAEYNTEIIVLDRPNPNVEIIDGPVLENEFSSFIGLHPVPLVYGMTIGEYALMVNGENWLKNGAKCKLKVIPLFDASLMKEYIFPIAPSPNLPNMLAVKLYPSLCLFEGTDVSVGRGTSKPFQCIGKPNMSIGDYSFTPESIPGVSDHPPHLGKECKGLNLSSGSINKNKSLINLEWIIDFYTFSENKNTFFNAYFKKLAGSDELQKQIQNGLSEEKIRESWKEDIIKFKEIRKRYLLYARL